MLNKKDIFFGLNSSIIMLELKNYLIIYQRNIMIIKKKYIKRRM